MLETTLCFLLRQDEILLARKKRGFGVRKWNGVGGKITANETVEQAMQREAQEEIGVIVRNYQKVADLKFYFPDYQSNPYGVIHVHAFLCSSWQKEPQESEEMSPMWYKIKDIPYTQMWADDKIWLPQALNYKRISANFFFDSNENIKDYKMKIVKSFKD